MYENAPQFVLQQRGDALLIEDLKTLLTYDLEGALSWFKDSGTAIMNLLTGFTNLKALYDYFNTNPEEAILIYKALQGAPEVQFATLLTTLAQLYTKDTKKEGTQNVASRRNVIFTIGKGYKLNSDILIADDQKNIKLERFLVKKQEVRVSRFGETEALDGDFNVSLEGPTIFHPLDLVTLKDANGNGEVPVCALEVKYLSDEAEWEKVINTTFIVVNIVSILISAGILSAGATGITAAFAVADIVVSSIDIGIILRRRELRGTEEGAWLDRNWEVISGTFAIISVGSALRQGLIKNGPSIIGKLRGVKDASAIAIRKRIQVLLFQVVINKEIAGFGPVAFKIVPIDQVRLIPSLKILQSNVERLWKLRTVVLESKVDGKAFYGLMYQGEVVLTGVAKEIDDFLKSKIFKYGAKDGEILKFLDEAVESVKKVKLRKVALARWIEKFELKFHKHFDGEIEIIYQNDRVTIARRRMVGAHNHEQIGKRFDIITIRKPEGVTLKKISNDIPFKANVRMTENGIEYTKQATSTFFPLNWDIVRVKEEISLVYDEFLKSGRIYHSRQVNRKFDFINSEGTFKIRIEFDNLDNFTNAYPIIN